MTGTIKLPAFEEHLHELLERIEEIREAIRDYFAVQEKEQPLILDVFSRYEMERYNKKLDDKCIVISINTPGREAIPIHALTLHLEVVDTATDRGMTARDALAIALFVRQNVAKGKNHVIIHSDQGISRSAGVAAGILRAYGMDTKTIINNCSYCINGRCYEYVCRAFNLPISKKDIESDVNRNHKIYMDSIY